MKRVPTEGLLKKHVSKRLPARRPVPVLRVRHVILFAYRAYRFYLLREDRCGLYLQPAQREENNEPEKDRKNMAQRQADQLG
jgi:hypothetical protein